MQWLASGSGIYYVDRNRSGPRRLGSYAKSGRQPGSAALSIPNIITLGRILLVPVIVWAIASGQMAIAFVLFIIAGVSDAVDGFLAKRFNMASEIGALLDPLADKALLVSIYVALGISGAVPRWLVILVVSRDIMIVRRRDRVVAVRQADADEAADGVEAQHGGAGGVCGLVLAALGFGFKSVAVRPDPDGLRDGVDVVFGVALSRGMGAPHEHDRGKIARRVRPDRRHGVTAWQPAFNLVSWRLRCRTRKASRATIFWKARPMPQRLRWSTAGRTGRTGS